MLSITTTKSEIESDFSKTIVYNSITALFSWLYNYGIVTYLINLTDGSDGPIISNKDASIIDI